MKGQTDLFIGEVQQSHKGQRYRQVLGHGAGQAEGRKQTGRPDCQEGTGHRGRLTGAPGGRPVPVQQRLGGFTEDFVPTDLHLVLGQRLLLETAE